MGLRTIARTWCLLAVCALVAACGGSTPAPDDAGTSGDGGCGTDPCPAGMRCALFGCTPSACPVCEPQPGDAGGG